MTLQEFESKYTNQKIDVDGGFPAENPYQCFDLAAAYSRDVVGAPRPYMPTTNGGIITSFTDYDKIPLLRQYYDKVINDSSNAAQLPPVGSLVFFSSVWGSGFGHVGICLVPTNMSFILLEQNNPVGSPTHAVTHPRSHYNTVLGWLVPKNNSQGDSDMAHPTADEVRQAYLGIAGREPLQEEIDFHMKNSSYKDMIEGFFSDANKPGTAAYKLDAANKQLAAELAAEDNQKAIIDDLTKKLADASASQKPAILDKETPSGKGFRTFYQGIIAAVPMIAGALTIPAVNDFLSHPINMATILTLVAGLVAYVQNKQSEVK